MLAIDLNPISWITDAAGAVVDSAADAVLEGIVGAIEGSVVGSVVLVIALVVAWRAFSSGRAAQQGAAEAVPA